MAKRDVTLEVISTWNQEMATKGIFNQNTARVRMQALKMLTSILGSDESFEPSNILESLDDITHRWATATNASPTSIPVYKSRAKKILSDYVQWQENPASLKATPRKQKSAPKKKPSPQKPAPPKIEPKVEPKVEPKALQSREPSLHIDVQIHIAADAKPDQIDQIFKSMAKHIYKK